LASANPARNLARARVGQISEKMAGFAGAGAKIWYNPNPYPVYFVSFSA